MKHRRQMAVGLRVALLVLSVAACVSTGPNPNELVRSIEADCNKAALAELDRVTTIASAHGVLKRKYDCLYAGFIKTPAIIDDPDYDLLNQRVRYSWVVEADVVNGALTVPEAKLKIAQKTSELMNVAQQREIQRQGVKTAKSQRLPRSLDSLTPAMLMFYDMSRPRGPGARVRCQTYPSAGHWRYGATTTCN